MWVGSEAQLPISSDAAPRGRSPVPFRPVTRLSDLLLRLREETRELHLALESRVDVMKPDLRPGEYRRLLEDFYGFYAPLEARLQEARPYGAEFDAFYGDRWKAPSLRRDLLSLGLTAGEVDRLPRCDALPETGTPARALGCLYVLEGATLGGRVITRHVRRTLGLRECGCAFFTSYGERVGDRWREFRAELRRRAPGLVGDEVVASACDTFASLKNWLARERYSL